MQKLKNSPLAWGAEAGREMVVWTGSPRQHTWKLGVFNQAVVLSSSGLSRVYMPRGRSDWKRSPRGLVCQRRSKKARENQGSILGTALKSYKVVFCFSLKTFFFFKLKENRIA